MREMKVYGISDNNDQCTFSGVTREDLRKAGMDDKTKALSESCLDNFDTQRDAVVVEHEAATDSANSHNRVHPAPAHRMHVIVPARNGVNSTIAQGTQEVLKVYHCFNRKLAALHIPVSADSRLGEAWFRKAPSNFKQRIPQQSTCLCIFPPNFNGISSCVY